MHARLLLCRFVRSTKPLNTGGAAAASGGTPHKPCKRHPGSPAHHSPTAPRGVQHAPGTQSPVHRGGGQGLFGYPYGGAHPANGPFAPTHSKQALRDTVPLGGAPLSHCVYQSPSPPPRMGPMAAASSAAMPYHVPAPAPLNMYSPGAQNMMLYYVRGF